MRTDHATQAQLILHHGERPFQEFTKDFDTSNVNVEVLSASLAAVEHAARKAIRQNFASMVEITLSPASRRLFVVVGLRSVGCETRYSLTDGGGVFTHFLGKDANLRR